MVNQEVGREDYAGFAQSIQTDSKMFEINTERASTTLHRTSSLKCGRVGVFQTGNPAKVRESYHKRDSLRYTDVIIKCFIIS